MATPPIRAHGPPTGGDIWPALFSIGWEKKEEMIRDKAIVVQVQLQRSGCRLYYFFLGKLSLALLAPECRLIVLGSGRKSHPVSVGPGQLPLR